MVTFASRSFFFLLVLVLFAVLMLGCDNGVPDPANNVSVTIAASGLSDGKLALNNAATFTADVTGYDDDPSGLGYRWTLSTGRGELYDGTNSLPNPAVGGNSIRCVGKTAGDEQIIVEVLDATNGLLATASVGFTIVPPTDSGISRGCFDQPKILFRRGSAYFVINYDGSERQNIGVSGGTTAAISPDGEWIAWNDDSKDGWDMYVQRCDGSEKTKILGGTSEDFFPQFSPDSKTLYFLRPEPSQEKSINAQRPQDIAAYDLATGQLRFLTTLYQLDERVSNFTVSPVTGEIAFYRNSYEDLPSGGYRVTIKLSFLQPESGLIRDFTKLPQARYDYGLDWSPDGGDIIFSSRIDGEQGIYRIKLTDGSQPLLVFRHLRENSVPPYYPHYYAGGSRIVWMGQSQENGQNNVILWSVDANGNDLQQITDSPFAESMQGVLH